MCYANDLFIIYIYIYIHRYIHIYRERCVYIYIYTHVYKVPDHKLQYEETGRAAPAGQRETVHCPKDQIILSLALRPIQLHKDNLAVRSVLAEFGP